MAVRLLGLLGAAVNLLGLLGPRWEPEHARSLNLLGACVVALL